VRRRDELTLPSRVPRPTSDDVPVFVELRTEPCLAFAHRIDRRSLHVILAGWVKYGTRLGVVKSAVEDRRKTTQPPSSEPELASVRIRAEIGWAPRQVATDACFAILEVGAAAVHAGIESRERVVGITRGRYASRPQPEPRRVSAAASTEVAAALRTRWAERVNHPQAFFIGSLASGPSETTRARSPE
jgi:hypothetical protein